jgi:hypothetical protein
MVLVRAGGVALAGGFNDPPPSGSFHFPTVPPEHRHARMLLENAMRYAAPENHIVDPVSGYPVEGWNQDPKRGLFLRSFTQLTAIGQWMELLANIVAGQADTPFISPAQALEQLTHLVRSLSEDQHDPRLSAGGLLGNFLDLATGKRLGPLAAEVDKKKFVDAFGTPKAEAIWKALQAKGWIVPRNQDREAAIQRLAGYGYEHFDGPLSPYADEPTRKAVMTLLDERVVMVVFGDNANLSASVAKTIGTLLLPAIKDAPGIAGPRRTLELFLDEQQAGYHRLYDAKSGLFNFGWDATRDRLFGWEDLQGNWTTGHVDYMVNEFRAPAMFVMLRFGIPVDAIKNLGFKLKSYRMRDGRDLFALAPWEGSAFQAMGLGLWLGELDRPSWRVLLENVVAIEIDYATRHGLPGFLSESYTGVDTQYTGMVGIPEITVAPRPRITDAASLYSLGAAYSIAPEQVEKFLGAHWNVVSQLLTDHGPWEGYNVSRHEAIPFQTTAHTLALILGLLRTGSEHMTLYLDSKGLTARRAELFAAGEKVDLLSDATRFVAWTDKDSRQQSRRQGQEFVVQSDRLSFLGVALIATSPTGINLSGGRLRIEYRSEKGMNPVTIALKPVDVPVYAAGLIPKEIFTSLAATNGRVAILEVPLPAMPGLTHVKEVVITHEPPGGGGPIDLSITGADFAP